MKARSTIAIVCLCSFFVGRVAAQAPKESEAQKLWTNMFSVLYGPEPKSLRSVFESESFDKLGSISEATMTTRLLDSLLKNNFESISIPQIDEGKREPNGILQRNLRVLMIAEAIRSLVVLDSGKLDDKKILSFLDGKDPQATLRDRLRITTIVTFKSVPAGAVIWGNLVGKDFPRRMPDPTIIDYAIVQGEYRFECELLNKSDRKLVKVEGDAMEIKFDLRRNCNSSH